MRACSATCWCASSAGGTATKDKPTTRWPTRQRLRFARCCYGHLAGQLGVELFSQLLSKEWLAPAGDGYLLTANGQTGLDALGFPVDDLVKSKSSAATRTAYRCLDWS